MSLDVHCVNAVIALPQGVPSMERAASSQNSDDDRIVLSLLNSVDDGAQTQRRIAEELGIALGLVNAYLKRCVKKGLVKVSEAPARRYAYYLTPKGFAEKSRLTVEYLSASFSFFRQAKADCAQAFELANERNLRSLVLAGKSDLAEIAILSAVDSGVSILAIVDPAADEAPFIGKPVVNSYERFAELFDAVMITDVAGARSAFEDAVRRFGGERVLAPRLLGLNTDRPERKQ